ncbi:hypothetical protein GALMADRAFT_148538 [Galerina marginata CBS 339.88]|uniref:Uncharacterized protein n=1 Tax=Galerina marginata (strain CBS 339.88) TaxID=685588 RepID=A0A067S4A6_GALM3|nr:hypothetical protein GALMADRAFT_148538 [Galerina marginata CBS 339.88]
MPRSQRRCEVNHVLTCRQHSETTHYTGYDCKGEAETLQAMMREAGITARLLWNPAGAIAIAAGCRITTSRFTFKAWTPYVDEHSHDGLLTGPQLLPTLLPASANNFDILAPLAIEEFIVSRIELNTNMAVPNGHILHAPATATHPLILTLVQIRIPIPVFTPGPQPSDGSLKRSTGMNLSISNCGRQHGRLRKRSRSN